MDELATAPLAASHRWDSVVDVEHLAQIRRDPVIFAPGGVSHLILEILPRLATLARAAWPLLSIQIIDQPYAEA